MMPQNAPHCVLESDIFLNVKAKDCDFPENVSFKDNWFHVSQAEMT